MTSLARAVYLDSEFGIPLDLPRAGSTLENPFVYDAVARELISMEAEGLIEVVERRQKQLSSEMLIDGLRYKRLR